MNNVKLFLIYIFFLTWFYSFPERVYAQLDIRLPDTVLISINNRTWIYSAGWLDSLKNSARNQQLKYRISGSEISSGKILTILKLPQTLNPNEVFQQAVLYYSILEDSERQKEEIYIYPFFNSLRQPPGITCTLSSKGEFKFRLNRWETIPVPLKPTNFEINLYNQILNNSFFDNNNFPDIPMKQIIAAAEEHHLDPRKAEEIFKKVVLWQASQ